MSWNLSAATARSTRDTPWPGIKTTLTSAEVWSLLRTAQTKLHHQPDEAGDYLQRAIALIEAELGTHNGVAVRPKGGLAGWQIRDLRKYVDENLGTPIRTSELVAIAKLSASHFSRAFKQSFGESPSAYVARRRVDRARQLILQTEKPLCEVALECGLCDQSHLSRMFKRFVGSSPLEWRRRNSAASDREGVPRH